MIGRDRSMMTDIPGCRDDGGLVELDEHQHVAVLLALHHRRRIIDMPQKTGIF
jgi:hypothetical protein